jgi:hypothetical protein
MAVIALDYARQQNFPSGINQYCPKLTGCAGKGDDQEYMMDLGTPALSAVSGILLTAATGATYTVTDFLATGDLVGGKIVSAPWGREIDFVASAAGTNVITLYGRDYLGQPIKKVSALNGTTRVVPGVAFKYLDSFVIASGGVITVNVGYTARLGLQYRTVAVNNEMADETRAAPGTLVAPVTTDPATNATGDPRGLYTTTTTLDGAARIRISALLLSTLNSSGNGGLHGIQHYGG